MKEYLQEVKTCLASKQVASGEQCESTHLACCRTESLTFGVTYSFALTAFCVPKGLLKAKRVLRDCLLVLGLKQQGANLTDYDFLVSRLHTLLAVFSHEA